MIDKNFFVNVLRDDFLLLGRLLVKITLNKFDIDQVKSCIKDCLTSGTTYGEVWSLG